MPRVPGSQAQKVYSGAGFCRELISDRACLLKKVHLVGHYRQKVSVAGILSWLDPIHYLAGKVTSEKGDCSLYIFPWQFLDRICSLLVCVKSLFRDDIWLL